MNEVYYNICKEFSSDIINLPNKFDNPKRNRSYFLARHSVSQILKHKFQQIFELPEIASENYHSITGDSSYSLSMAHTKNLAASVIAKKNDKEAFGIDLEFKSRPMKESAARFFQHSEDLFTGSLLELWCIKESSFKALANYGYPIKLLKEVIIKNNQFSFEADPGKTFPFELIYKDDLIISISLCTENEYQLIEVSYE